MARDTESLDLKYETKFPLNIDVAELEAGLASFLEEVIGFDEGSKAFYRKINQLLKQQPGQIIS